MGRSFDQRTLEKGLPDGWQHTSPNFATRHRGEREHILDLLARYGKPHVYSPEWERRNRTGEPMVMFPLGDGVTPHYVVNALAAPTPAPASAPMAIPQAMWNPQQQQFFAPFAPLAPPPGPIVMPQTMGYPPQQQWAPAPAFTNNIVGMQQPMMNPLANDNTLDMGTPLVFCYQQSDGFVPSDTTNTDVDQSALDFALAENGENWLRKAAKDAPAAAAAANSSASALEAPGSSSSSPSEIDPASAATPINPADAAAVRTHFQGDPEQQAEMDRFMAWSALL